MINILIRLTSLIELNVVAAFETKVYEDMIVHRGLISLGYRGALGVPRSMIASNYQNFLQDLIPMNFFPVS